MAELLRPDVYVEEVASPPGVPTVSVSTGAFVGIADRGPVNEAVFIDSFTSYIRTFGSYRSDSYLTYAVKGFFDNGGSRCYVVRVVGNTGSPPPNEAEATLVDFDPDTSAYLVKTRYVGAFGNYVKYSTTRFETTLAAAIPSGASTTSCTLSDVSGIFRGDVLYIDDGVDQAKVVVQSIDISLNTVTFAAPVNVVAEIALAARVATSSQHRITTQTSAIIPTGAATMMTVASASSIRIGQILTISDGTTLKSITVTGINGNDIIFASTDLSPGFAIGALVVSQEFMLRIYDAGEELAPYEFLSPSATNRQDYVENRLAGESNESLLIEVEESTGSAGYLKIPLPVIATSLTTGADGAAPVDADYVGTEANGYGLHALDGTSDFSFLSAPGVTSTTVQQGGVDYAGGTGRQDIIFICDAPSTSDLVPEIRDWRLNTLNRDSSYASLYYPWIQISDPEVDGQLLYLPPSGHVMGVYSQVARTTGPHTPPANIALSGVNGVMYEVSDPEHDILNPIGVNVIRGYPGEGIRIMGARTLQNAPDGKHYVNVRNLTNFIKVSLRRGLRAYLMRAIDPSLWSQISNTCGGFMLGIWRSGWLYPSDDASAAYLVKCDSENNPQDVVNQGRVNVAVGYNPPFPAEFIVLRLSRIGGNVEVSE